MGAYELLLEFKVMDAITTIYTDVLGGWFFVFIGLMIPIAVYLKTESPEATGMAMLILGLLGVGGSVSGFVNKFPGASEGTGNIAIVAVWALITVVGLGMLVMKWWRGK